MIFILICVYNELENLTELHDELVSRFAGKDVHYVFSDDGSTDGSSSKLKELFTNEKCEVLGDSINRGPGFAFNTGFEWILKNSKDRQNDKIISLEADNTSDLSIANKILKISDLGFDMVLPSVYLQGGELQNTTRLRKLLSFFANMLLRFKFDIKVLTLSSFYRLYSVALINNIKNKYGVIIREPGFISMIEILLKAIKTNASIIEIPVKLLSEKRKGVSKMKKFRTIIGYIKFFWNSKIK